jgi:TP901 family phage tail tape measure protein
MAMNLEAVLKIAAKVTGLQDLGALEKGLIGAERAAGAAKGGFKAMLDSSAWQGAAVAAAGIGVALGLSVKAAIDFEESMAEVRKVVSGLESPKALQEIQQEIFGLSREIPITAKGFAEMYAAAGQAGIPREELRAFAIDVSKVAIAFDMTAEEAGNAMAKLRTNLGLTQPELMDLADAANYLSNNMASTAKEIVDFMLRSGAAGKQAGLSAEQTAAFGSAMIASGAQAEVASTSFNNMIKALSRGPSMTERQISALVRLGYGMADAAKVEQELTQAVEEQSQERLDAYRRETDGALKEINRRYRDQMQALEDGWDDEQSGFEDAASDRLEAQIKALGRQRDAEIEASNQRAEASGTSNRNELNRISDFYDERIDALRDANSAEMKARQRQARDQQQQVKDQLDDQKEMEIDAVQQKYDELKTIEEARKKLAIDDAKATAKAIVGELGTNMAAMLQKDAIGTIRDVFGRIKALPAEMQMSVISDLFGDEARALLPLITNTQLMEQALGLVGDKSKYAGSTAEEFKTRLSTTASQLQLAQNNLNELSITFGTKFLPYITKALELLEPLATGLANLAKQFPLLTSVVGGLALAFVGLIAVAPFISGFITLLGQLATLKIGATIAGWAAAILPLKAAFAGFLAWASGTLIPGLLAIFSGPVGWTVLAVAAVVAMAVLFRKPLGDFLKWLGSVFKKGWDGFVDNILKKPLTDYFKWWKKNWDTAKDIVGKVFKGLVGLVKAPMEGIATIIKNTLRLIFKNLENAFNNFANRYNNLIKTVKKSGFGGLFGLLPEIPLLSLPKFAQGGVVTRPTVAMVGEGGESEYIIPESKMDKALDRFMIKAQGINAGGDGNPTINITTGPVVQMNGEQYVTVSDMQAAMQATARGVLGSLRNPTTRISLGLA